MWQPILMINGYFVSLLGFAMLFPALVDMYYTKNNWSPFVTSSIISIFIGLSLFLANRTTIKKISLQQGYLLTVLSWFTIAVLSTLPFMLYNVTDNWFDAFFESTSGITTTGATIFSDLESLPKSVLMWRSTLNGMGGVGIVIFAVAMMPFLGIGGMQIFQRENSDLNDKFMPKISYIAKRIILVYGVLVLLCSMSLKYAGMNWFDAINHALSTISTGGFSTKNSSVGYFDNVYIEVIITIFMILGALPLMFYIMLMQRQDLHSFRTMQVSAFLRVLVLYILFMSCWLDYNGIYGFFRALRYSSFNIVSIATSTGFASTDYMLWGNFVAAAFVIFALTGGCTGSTSGSIKIFRWQVVIAYLKKSITNATEPNRLVPAKIGCLTIDDKLISSVLSFMVAYIFSLVVLILLVSITGLGFETSVGAVVACITNSGPGIGPIVGPAGNFSSLSNFAKFVLSFAMILGRLEVLTVLVVLTKSFWKR